MIEVFEDGEWKFFDYVVLPNELHKIINRRTSVYSAGPGPKLLCEVYYLGHTIHRLDGPAQIVKDQDIIIQEFWYVKGKCLQQFHMHFNPKSIRNSIIYYITRYPQFLDEVKILANHNEWFEPEELILLDNAILFF